MLDKYTDKAIME